MNKFAPALLAILLLGTSSCGVWGFWDGESGHTDGVSSVLNEGASLGADGARVSLQMQADGALALNLVNLSGAKTIFGELRYDPAAMHLVNISPASSDDESLVLIADQPDQGCVVFGWALPAYTEREGIHGTIQLGSLKFAEGAAAVRAAAKAPTGNGNAFTISGSVDGAGVPTLTWLEALQGDGDNNGEVNITDLAPLAASFRKTPDPVDPADSVARDADYDKNGEVNINDLAPLAAGLGTSLGGFEILAGPNANNLSDLDEYLRSEAFDPLPKTTDGELTWTWTGAAILVDTTFAVIPFDTTGPGVRGRQSDNTVTLTAPIATQTVSDITVSPDPAAGLTPDGDGDYVVVLTENSVDATAGNAEPLAGVLELLQLKADVDTLEDPGNIFDGTDIVIWRLIEGGGLAEVGNGGTDPKGQVTFIDRGRIVVEAHAVGNFAVKDTIAIKLYSIQDIQLAASPGGAGPVNVPSGTGVSFTATGVFDFDGTANGNEISRDITPFCNWGMLPGVTNTGSFTFDTGDASLATINASSGDSVQVEAEFPTTANVTLYDNMRKGSNYVQVDIN